MAVFEKSRSSTANLLDNIDVTSKLSHPQKYIWLTVISLFIHWDLDKQERGKKKSQTGKTTQIEAVSFQILFFNQFSGCHNNYKGVHPSHDTTYKEEDTASRWVGAYMTV